MGGPTILIEWISTLPGSLKQTLASKLLIEPVVRIQLAIIHYVITYDFDSRAQLYLNQSACLLSLLFSMSTAPKMLVLTILLLHSWNMLLEGGRNSPVCFGDHCSGHLHSHNQDFRRVRG